MKAKSKPNKKEKKIKEHKKMGRPTIYSNTLGIEVCRRITEGETLVNICKTEGMPSLTSIYRWLLDDKIIDFRKMYDLARLNQADTFADEIIKIADESNPTNATVDKLRVDARKWVASKLRPGKYAEIHKLEHDTSSNLSEILREISKRDKSLLPED